MADNVDFQAATLATPPSGTKVSTDDAGASGQVQRVKLAMSADGSATHVPADADGLLVNLGANNDVTVTGTVTAVASGDHTVVGKAADGAAVAGNPVLVAGQDGTNAQSIRTDANGELQVDVLTLPAIPAGTNNIGDVDVLTVPAPLSTTGGGTEATALRVTVASDSTGVVSVDDNGGSLTVDGTVAVSGTVTVDSELTTADLDTGAGTDTRAVVGLAKAASGGAVLVSDTNGLPAVIRTPAGDSAMDEANDAVRVNIIAGAGSGGTAMTDDAAFTPASTSITPAGAMFDDVTPDSVDEGDGGVLRMSGNRNLYTNLRDGTGAERGAAVTAANALKVDGSAVTQPVSGTVTSNAGTGTRDAQGNVAHDAPDSGNPVKMGAKAVAHGANPTAVAAADRTDLYANRHGVQFTIGGHPNATTWVYNTTAAQTDDNVLAAIATGTKYVVTRVTVALDEATTVGVGVRLGFGATTLPALGASAADGVAGLLVSHPGLVPGGGITVGDGSGILGVGGDGEELRITCDVPTSGRLDVSVTGFTIES